MCDLFVLSISPFSDIERIQSGIGDKVALFLQYFSTFLAGFIIGYATSWKLALVVSVMLPILTFMAAVMAKVGQQNTYQNCTYLSDPPL